MLLIDRFLSLQKKKRTHVTVQADPTKKGPPKSFVMRRGHVGKMLRRLEQDLRNVMMPHTAQNLKASGNSHETLCSCVIWHQDNKVKVAAQVFDVLYYGGMHHYRVKGQAVGAFKVPLFSASSMMLGGLVKR